MQPLIQHNYITLHGDPDPRKATCRRRRYTNTFTGSFLQGIKVTCLSRGQLFDFSDSCKHCLLIWKGKAIIESQILLVQNWQFSKD